MSVPSERVAALAARIQAALPYSLGFPASTDADQAPLGGLLSWLLNNVGDPYVDGPHPYAGSTKDIERQVVDWVADLLRAPAGDRWGYVTTGGSESNMFGLRLARQLHPRAMTYVSAAAHSSVTKALDLQQMPYVEIATQPGDEMDYVDLARAVARFQTRPAIVVATAGTTMTEAVDDIRKVIATLDRAGVTARFIHVDAALSGIPLALLDPSQRPGFDFADGAHCVALSGHKFVGAVMPCGVVVTSARLREQMGGEGRYTGCPDVTISGSRPGLAPVLLWDRIQSEGTEGMRRRAEAGRELARYAQMALRAVPWPASRHEHALTVYFPSPPDVVHKRWPLATHDGISHLICMPGVTQHSVDALVSDLGAALLRRQSCGPVLFRHGFELTDGYPAQSPM